MRTTHAIPSLPLPAASSRGRLRVRARLFAHLRASRTDRDLASGVAPWCSRVHATRSLQLTSMRSRRSLARSLERLLKQAEHPSASFQSAAISPCREQVYPARAVIGELASRLRSGRPVAARGVARLRALLCDGAGPCYVPSEPDALTNALETVSEWLSVED